MNRLLRGYVVFLRTFAVVLLIGVVSTPVASRAATQVDAHAEDCDVAPRSLEDVAVLASTPAAPALDIADVQSPGSDDVVLGITETVSQAIACANANDVLRSFALFTDRYVAERFGTDHPDDLGSLRAALSRTPVPSVPEELLTLVDLSDVVSFSDSWAGATVTTSNRDAQYTDRLVFELVSDQWLIDSWTQVEERPATPTAK